MAHVGRGVFWKKTRTDQCRSWDISSFARDVDLSQAAHGYTLWGTKVNPTASIGWEVVANTSVRVHYTFTAPDGNKTDFSYFVGIDHTPCYFGGGRWWWLCPACHRRCRILYQPPGSRYFACRICHKLTYASQQESHNRLVSTIRFLNNWPRWQRRLNRLRSPHKRERLLRQLGQVEADMRLTLACDKRRKQR